MSKDDSSQVTSTVRVPMEDPDSQQGGDGGGSSYHGTDSNNGNRTSMDDAIDDNESNMSNNQRKDEDKAEGDNKADFRNNSSDGDSEGENEGNGLSAYELLRLENVRRNNERLKLLGLASKDGGGLLGKKKSHQKRRRRSTGNNESVPTAPQRRSRRSAGTVSYVEPSLREVLKSDQGQKPIPPASDSAVTAEAEEATPKPGRERPPKDDRSQRMARFVYDEFHRIRQHKKLTLKEAEKNKKSAETEIKYWQKKAAVREKRAQKAMEAERLQKQQQEELESYGTSIRSFVHNLDRRTAEITYNIHVYDSHLLDAEARVEVEARRLENEHRLKLLDALDAYPKAMKEATRSLSAIFLDRAPKDLPPPRRSKRKGEDEVQQSEPPHKKSKRDGSESEEPKVGSFGESAALCASATQESFCPTETAMSTKDHDESSLGKSTDEGKARKKRELNVGGWVSPTFSPNIDRAWLEKDSGHSEFHPNTYVPQPGDTVLYYLAGHRDFLSQYPDHLAKKLISRLPLWERAAKERIKAAKNKLQNQAGEQEPKEKSTPFSPRSWWTESWLSEIGGKLAHYPLVCKVEKTQAEFPPDPTPIVNGEWVLTETNSRPKGKMAMLRLAVSLRPLTTVLPPCWTEWGPVDKHPLSLPPSFTVVMFPSPLPPFIIPFSWAYVHNHSLAISDDIVITRSKDPEKGQIRSFETLDSLDEEHFGSFRLEDKLKTIADICCTATSEDSSNQEADDCKGKTRPVQTVPPQDAFVISEFLSRFLITNGYNVKCQIGIDDMLNSHLVILIRSSLPLWKGVSVMHDVYDRKTYFASVWEVNPRNARGKNDYLSQKGFMDLGLCNRTLDDVLGQKIECTIEDFLRERPDVEVFRPVVTDEIAQFYSCAVPLSMSFARIHQRLRQRKGGPNGISKGYYRSFAAVLQDINAIQDNCSLYNAADSAIVAMADDVIPAMKKLLHSVFTSHFREHKEKLRQDDEKRKFLAAVVSSDPLLSQASETRSQSKSVDHFQEPFKGPLYRDWVQLMDTDVTSKHTDDGNNQKSSYPQWVPQTGDPILYSREMHKKFVEGHFDSLEPRQCVIPPLNLASPSDQEGTLEESSSKEKCANEGEADQTGWLVGRVAGIRAEFPRARAQSKSSADEGAFATDSPILAVAVQFPCADPSQTFVMFWRPCLFPCDAESDSELSTGICKFCGVYLATSFLCPSWANQFGGNLPIEIPLSPDDQGKLRLAIPKEEADAIELNLTLLKRRCMNQVPADYCDPNLTADKVKHGYLPPAIKVGQRFIPSFEELMRTDFEGSKTSTILGVRALEPSVSLLKLAGFNFVPPWLPHTFDTKRAQGNATTLQDSISPWPKLSLELVLIRLRNGFYRSRLQLRMDIMEAFATSCVLSLAPDAKRKKNPLSIKKLAGVLSSRKYVQRMRSGGGKKTIDKITHIGMTPKSPQAAVPKDANEGPVIPKKSKKQTPFESHQHGGYGIITREVSHAQPKKQQSLKLRKTVLTEEENMWVSRLENVRRLYAAALVGTTEIATFMYVNGLVPMQVSRPLLKLQMIVVSPEDERAARAREVLATLVVALGRDHCTNRYPMTPSESPTMKVRITVDGETIKGDDAVSELDSTQFASSSSAGGAELELSCNPSVASTNGRATADAATTAFSSNENNISNSAATSVEDSIGHTLVSECVSFGIEDFEENESICRMFFGKPGRMFQCVRCQASKRSMIYCRVVKAHSNIDFDVATNFKGVGGLDGLLRILLKQPEPIESVKPEQVFLVANLDSCEGANEPDSSKKASEQTQEPKDTINNTKSKHEGTFVKNSSGDDAVALAEVSQKDSQCDEKNGMVQGLANTNSEGIKMEEKDDFDPRDVFRRAEAALALANELYVSATQYAEAPPRLSDTFISETFPVDPTDGKYVFCIVCGLSGDLLICDRDGCRNVVHPTCADISEIPEGDWFCDKCTVDKSCTNTSSAVAENNAILAVSEDASGALKGKAVDCSPVKPSSSDTGFTCLRLSENGWQTSEAGNAELTEVQQDAVQMADESAKSHRDDHGVAENFKEGEFPKGRTERLEVVKSPSVGTIPPIVTFDEEKATDLSDELQHLYFLRTGLRTGRRRVGKSEEAAETGEQKENAEEEHQMEVKNPHLTVGMIFEKKFGGHGYFAGTITELPTGSHPFYRVTYEDGDQEDLSEKEIIILLDSPRARKTVRKKDEGVKKKRGRPRKVQNEESTTYTKTKGEAEDTKVEQGKQGNTVWGGVEPHQDRKEFEGENQEGLRRQEPIVLLDGARAKKAERKEEGGKKKRGRPRKVQIEDGVDMKNPQEEQSAPAMISNGESADSEVEKEKQSTTVVGGMELQQKRKKETDDESEENSGKKKGKVTDGASFLHNTKAYLKIKAKG